MKNIIENIMKTNYLPAFKIVFHYLLHIKDSIIDCGPCWTFWQFPMERLCGILQTLVQSHIFPYENLANNILILDQFNYLYFILPLQEQVFHKKYLQIIQIIKYLHYLITLKNFGFQVASTNLLIF
ncbi:hypothetical protein C2G38_968132 [Gigaspora rosea]|uniref:Uncharacterized protein n=1 Tax=Gigaspora rosea TaxID=44941 RepID=A0A397WB46_9GLOM|nr:hypothetical protein C2G38_968132 [Gigaspora rosea]